MAPGAAALLFCVLVSCLSPTLSSVSTLPVSACADPSTVSRPCTTFEVHAPTCYCPGKGPSKVSFVLDIGLISVRNVPGAQTAMKTLIGVNGTSPGPTLRVTENDWVEVTVRNRLPLGSSTTVHWHGSE